MITLKTIVSGQLANNTVVLHDDKSAVVIDPQSYSDVRQYLVSKGLGCEAVILTHGHYDHLQGVARLQKDGAKVYIHTLDSPMTTMGKMMLGFESKTFEEFVSDYLIEDGFEYRIGDVSIMALHTPGHSPGSVCLIVDGALDTDIAGRTDRLVISGDTLFCGGMGRTDLPGGSYPAIMKSLRVLFDSFSDETLVLPGHGGTTTIGQEK